VTSLFDLVSGAAIANLSYGDYVPIRDRYRIAVESAIVEYLYGEGVKITKFRNRMKIAIAGAFVPAFEQGLLDGGGEKRAQGDDLEWVNARVEKEFGFVDELFSQLKDLKKEAAEDPGISFDDVARGKADSYARTLDGVYAQGKARGAKNRMLTFVGTDGKENCATCKKLKGQRHRASWWKNRGLLIFRGNDNYECGCWECQHGLVDDNGEIFTI
jgi:hypothetical protein